MKEKQQMGYLMKKMRRDMKMKAVDAAKICGVTNQGNYSKIENYGLGLKAKHFHILREKYELWAKNEIMDYKLRMAAISDFVEILKSQPTTPND